MNSSPSPQPDQTADSAPLLSGTDKATFSQSDMPTGAPPDQSISSPSVAVEVGSRLAGYKLIQKLGEGGMGAVFIAEDVALRRKVALKTMKPELAAKETSKQRFFREARAVARIEHDNIVPIFQVGEDRGIPFLAMALLKGESLGDSLKKNARPDVPFILTVGRDVAEGLAAAHQEGLIHRDIKPDNIWIEPQPRSGGVRAKILDFGLARPQDEEQSLVTQEGAILGTPAYMAPEQARGMTVDHRADLFSLGVMLYQMATGQRPFTGRDTMAILSSLALDTPADPQSLNPELPPILSKLIMRLLEKSVDKRVQKATDVSDVLKRLQPRDTVVVVATPQAAEPNPWADIDASSMTNVEPPSPPLAASRTEPTAFVSAKAVPRPRDAASGKTRSKKPFYIGGVLALAGAIMAAIVMLGRDKNDPPADKPDGSAKIEEPARKRIIPPDVVSPIDWALQFDGRGSIEVPTIKNSRHQSLCMEGYFQPLEFTADIFGRDSILLGFVDEFQLGHSNHSSVYKELIWKAHLELRDSSHMISSRNQLKIGERVHVAVVRDGNTARLYVGGKKVAWTSEDDAKLINQGSTLRMAGNFRGTMDEIRLSTIPRYDVDFLPDARLKNDENTLALYHFDEGDGDVLKDSSGNNHHGKIVGAKWVKVEGTPIGALPAKFKNDLGMEFALVPKGNSWLGGGNGKPGNKEVEFKEDFYLGVYEVTQEEWQKVMGNNPSGFARSGKRQAAVKDIPDADLKRLPVESITSEEVAEFIEQLNAKTNDGWRYRLPTRSEWEYACRGGPMMHQAESAFDFYFDQPTNTPSTAKGNFSDSGLKRTAIVGSYLPNSLGIHDLHGNVWEWVTPDALGKAQPSEVRGGSFHDQAANCQAALLSSSSPTSRSDARGLRLARVPATKP